VTTSAASSTLVITGHGWGHGMGMGQWGAYGYALHGWSYTRILRHYYQGTTIATGSSPTVRVLLADRKRRVTLDSASPWKAVDRNGTTVDLPAGRLVVPASLELAGRTLSAPVTFEPGATPLEVGSVAYRGKLVVTSTGARMQLVNAVNLEAYIEGVVGAEMPNYWPQAALEAQAVAARTYALSELSNVVTANTFDLYDDTRSQVYSGIAAETPSIARAVAATARRVVLYRGKVATTYFSSSTGGETVSAAEALGTPIPYLVSVADPYDTLSPNHDWGPVLMSTRSVGKALGLGGPVDDLATEAASSGHIARVTASGLDTQQTMSGTHIEYELGLRSSWFEFAWLTLTPPAGPVVSGAQVTLTGTVRGLKDVSLEARAKGGTWALLGPVKPDATGRFTIRVSPSVTTSYRLATGTIRGALVSVAVTN
jgi:stage II sporulation protein D